MPLDVESIIADGCGSPLSLDSKEKHKAINSIYVQKMCATPLDKAIRRNAKNLWKSHLMRFDD